MTADASAALAPPGWRTAPRLTLADPDDLLPKVLRVLSVLVLKYPVAAQALCTALVAEGRRFAQTPEGRRWKMALANSALACAGRTLWERSALFALEDSPDVVIPTAVVDAVVRAVSRTDLERALIALIRADSGDGQDAA